MFRIVNEFHYTMLKNSVLFRANNGPVSLSVFLSIQNGINALIYLSSKNSL